MREKRGIEKDFEVPIIIENVTPEIDGGIFAAKSVVGDPFIVEADIFRDGYSVIAASLKYRKKNEEGWQEVPMKHYENDRWRGVLIPTDNTLYLYTLEAWADHLTSWFRFMEKKCPANSNVSGDLAEGLQLIEKAETQAKGKDLKKISHFKNLLELSDGGSDEVLRIIQNEDFREAVLKYPVKDKLSSYGKELPLFVDRKRAEFGAWYEMFPRSQGKSKSKSGTFKDCIRRLPDIKKMGFDVIYLPPIHPIGTTFRKGKNNSLEADKDSPGSPWAIGNKEGGHKAVHPELGTLEDFEDFVQAAREYEMEIALDLAYQCSPDHPYVKEHPEWFYRLPDGTIRYAENPPKKYQDIYPIDFYSEDHEALWEELRSIVFFWIAKGVRIFRVDNPHTKPLRFWKWLIDTVQEKYPDVLFLAEAFTRPKVMKYLAKAGFSQSYTYFTWRNQKWDLRQYLQELTMTEIRHYFRPNFFANTPDILHEYLQKGGRPAFKVRLVLAATLSGNYGIYSGYELCENKPIKEGSEEYLNSEKYEIRVRDWNQPGNIIDYIARINRIRAENPALQKHLNLEFFQSENEQILCYGKKTPDNSNVIVVVVNLDPFRPREDLVALPIWKFGIEEWQTYQAKDLITGDKYYWKGSHNYIRLDPEVEPAHILSLKK
ncbi:MAG: alpha-1,4-glucan--maltose-1-phosphate maltosyltransferase [Candidatus Omnitrophica bacterium]|nr:alpha-1,4-glucan--maltose-1-phosphate maltosyltransferase [Candidatus Omnitrophota bacterium]